MSDARLGFDGAREEQELREYLGERFDLSRLRQYEAQLVAEFSRADDERDFYRHSSAYLYNLTAFAMTGTKLPYLRALVCRVKPPARVLDYGCGIGSDGLLLLAAGYEVEFADFDNPSVEYLRWRLARRGLAAPIHDLDAGVPEGFDVAYAFDVIEHAEDPFAFLGEMERRARLVEVNFLRHRSADQTLHRALPLGALLRHVGHHRLRYYHVFHGRSHLVIYDSESAGGRARLLSRWRLAAGGAMGLASRAGRRLRHAGRRATSRRVGSDPPGSGPRADPDSEDGRPRGGRTVDAAAR